MTNLRHKKSSYEERTHGNIQQHHKRRQRRPAKDDPLRQQSVHRRRMLFHLRLSGAQGAAGVLRGAALPLHVSDLRRGEDAEGTPRVLHSSASAREEPVRHGVRGAPAQRAQTEGRREGMRPMDAPQGEVQVEHHPGLHEQLHARLRRRRDLRLQSHEQLHHGRPRLRAGQQHDEHRRARRIPRKHPVPADLQSGVERQGKAQGRHRRGHRHDLHGLSGEPPRRSSTT